MPSSKRNKRVTDEILDDFEWPNSQSKNSASNRSNSVTSERAIDRYVISVLSESGENSIFSAAKRSAASASHQRINFEDDVSFAPINPFDAHPGERFANTSWKAKIIRNWRPLTVILLGVILVSLISAGIFNSKDKGEIVEQGSKMVGMKPVKVTVTPTKQLSSLQPTLLKQLSNVEPTYLPTLRPVSLQTIEPTHLQSIVPTYLPTGASLTQIPSTSSLPLKIEVPLAITVQPTLVKQSISPMKVPTSNPTLKPTLKTSTTLPTAKPSNRPTMHEKYNEMMKAAKFVSGVEPFYRTDTAQSLAFHWLYFEGNPSNNLYEFFEQYATAVIFFSLTKMRMSSMTSLLPQDDFTTQREVCGWSGVRCAYNYTSETVHVTEIRLPEKRLKGTIPSEIGFLPFLVKLDLAENEIAGTIPDELYGLQRLRYLYLNKNNLQGTISSRIDRLHLAEYIYLGQNSLTGTFPTNVGTNRPNNWRMLSLYSNKVTGTLPEGMSLRNAYMLDFSHNNFHGKLPADINQGNYTKLRLLYLNNNRFSGTIPESILQLWKLKSVFLNDNLFIGGIPDLLNEQSMVSLLTIRVQNNSLTTNVSKKICDLDVNHGEYELVELGVDCKICNGCSLCNNTCY